LARALGVTQKTAWFMVSRLRPGAQSSDGGKLGGEVEVNETFIGGKARSMPMVGKTDVLACWNGTVSAARKCALRSTAVKGDLG
jgi:hypothetical protein